MEDKSDIIEAFSEMAPRYEQVVDSELNRFWGWSYQGFVNLILASSPINQQDIVLDVATGTGVIPFNLQKAGHPHNQIHGLDITMSMLKRARVRLTGLYGQVIQNLVCASAMDMPYSKAAFSQVIWT
jgi:ubiquinone/menaquinone biosynthesis C-methylase UbiE